MSECKGSGLSNTQFSNKSRKCSHKRKKHKKINAYRKSVQAEPTVVVFVCSRLRSQLKGKQSQTKNSRIQLFGNIQNYRKFKVSYYQFLFQLCLTAQKMMFSIKDFFSKCDQVRRKLCVWSHLLKKSLMKNFFFVQCLCPSFLYILPVLSINCTVHQLFLLVSKCKVWSVNYIFF